MFMKRKKKIFFNLIEVALAIGILAIGLTTILSLFPLGFDRARESVGENYCAEAADTMFAYIANQAYKNWSVINSIPTTKPSSVSTNPSTWTQPEGYYGDIYQIPSALAGVYGIKVSTLGGAVDFTGEALLWKTKVKNLKVAGYEIGEIDYSKAAGINLEISWPAEKQYAQRKKNTYYFELFNFNQ